MSHGIVRVGERGEAVCLQPRVEDSSRRGRFGRAWLRRLGTSRRLLAKKRKILDRICNYSQQPTPYGVRPLTPTWISDRQRRGRRSLSSRRQRSVRTNGMTWTPEASKCSPPAAFISRNNGTTLSISRVHERSGLKTLSKPRTSNSSVFT